MMPTGTSAKRMFVAVSALGLLAFAGRVWAQSSSIGSLLGPSATDGTVVVESQFTAPSQDKPGELFLVATIREGWHIYSITQAPGGPIATKILLNPSDAFQLAGPFEPSPPPKKYKEPLFDNLLVESHHGRVVWHAPLRLAAGVDPAALRISGRVQAQPCDPKTCLPPQDYPFVATLGPGVALPRPAAAAKPSREALPPAAKTQDDLPWQPFSSMADFEKLTGFDPSKPIEGVQMDAGGGRPESLWRNVLLGFLGGLILNIMPCVLPVIGLKILSFIEQAGHDRRRAFFLNVWYSLGLLSVFVLLAVLAMVAGYGWGQLFSLQGFNITLAAVVFAMGLSFLGVWEVPIPGFATSGAASSLAAREGAAGAFAKGVLTTFLATPCSAPFLAPALAWAVSQPTGHKFAVFISVGLGMASPYLLIGAFPVLIRFLPKPGAWMDTFKQVMGFVLLGTVVYIFTFLEAALVAPTIGLLFGLWAACWWIGRTPMTAGLGAQARAWAWAGAFAGIVWVLMFPGTRDFVSGKLAFRGLSAVMQERFDRKVALQAMTAQARGPAVAAGIEPTVLVDFTADWCLTCKTLEAFVLNSAPVRQLVARNGVITLQADFTDYGPEVARMLELLGGKQVPVVAIFPAGRPNEPIILRGGCTRQTLLEALEKAGPSKPAL